MSTRLDPVFQDILRVFAGDTQEHADLPEYDGPVELIEEARRCPTCDSRHHRECDEDAIRSYDSPTYFCPFCQQWRDESDHYRYCYLNPGRKSDGDY